MGFYTRKPIRFGVGNETKGNYVQIGEKGVSYWVAIKQIQDPSSPQGLIDEINKKSKKISIWPFTLLFIIIPIEGIFLAIAAALTTYFFVDKIRKTAVIYYDIETQAKNEIEQFYESFTEIMKCSMKWYVSSDAKRSPIEIFHKSPPGVKTNVQVPAIPIGERVLYFFPERLLVYEGKHVRAIGYDSLEIEQCNQRFVETEKIPEDGTIEDHDRKSPVLLYSVLRFTGDGLDESIQLSKADAGSKLSEQLKEYKNSVFFRKKVIDILDFVAPASRP